MDASSTIPVDLKEFRKAKPSEVEGLVRFLGEELGIQPTLAGDDLSLQPGEAGLSKREVRDALKRFLYKRNLKGEFKVISSGAGQALKKR